jgi:predicted permease
LLSLALGIGANTALFTVADQLLLRRLPVRHAAELLYFTSPGPYSGFVLGENRFSYPMYRDLRDNTAAFDAVAARFSTALSLTYNNRSERIQAELVSGTWFDTLGLDIRLGRPLGPEDDHVPGGHSVCVLTYDFWRSRFASDRAIVNKVVLLNGHPMVIVGVAARGYRGFDVGERVDVLVPAMMKAAMTPTWNGLEDRRFLWVQIVGRLHPGVTPQMAEARLRPFYHALLRIEAETATFRSAPLAQEFTSKPLSFVPAGRGVSELRAELSAPIRILTAIVGLLLLIACANVASLLLARAVGRQREIAIRLALGARRGHLVRQLVVESVLISLVGGAIGLIVAAWTVSGLLGILANPAGMALSAALDGRVFAFTFVLAAITGVVFGLAPAWKATSPDLANVLKDSAGTAVVAGGHVRMRKVLVVSQVAISVLLLITAALFTRSLRNLNRIDLGFHPDRLLSFSVDPSLNSYTPERIRTLAETLQQKVGTIPGVRSAAVAANTVIADSVDIRSIRFQARLDADERDLNPYVDSVTPGYLATMGIPLVEGRDFTPRDRNGAPRVAIVNEVFARYYFPEGGAVGRRFGFGHEPADNVEIVGVARSSKYLRIDEQAKRVVYTPLLQESNPSVLVAYARTSVDPRAVFAAVRREVAQLDASLPLTNLRTMQEQVAEALAAQRLMATLSLCFAALATVLAAVGLYGVIAYMMTRRTREIGIRQALGADHGLILGHVMREAGRMTAMGIAVAIPLALILARFARTQLYGIDPWDPLSILVAVAAGAAVALIAAYIPAARALGFHPIAALRHQ